MNIVSEHHLLIFLLQFAILLTSCKVFGYFLEKLKQPTITGDVLVGIILGPAILGHFFSNIHISLFPDDPIQWSMLETIAWFGKLLLLLDTGLGTNFSKVWKQRSNAIRLSICDLILPIILCSIPFYFLPSSYLIDPSKKIVFSLFIATIMTISALPVAIRDLREQGILKTDVGFLILSTLTLNDVGGWILFTIILGIFSQGSSNVFYTLQIIGLISLFTLFSFTILKKVVDWAVTLIHTKIGHETGYKLTFIIIFGMVMGVITQKMGFHSLFGFFIAGIVAGEAKYITEKDRETIHRMVSSIFVPIFFALIGLQINILANLDIPLVLFITFYGIFSRFIAAYLGSIWAKQNKLNRTTIAMAHTPGGEMHIVVAMLAYTTNLITERIFVSIVIGAIFSMVIFVPLMGINLRTLRKKLVSLIFNKSDVHLDYSRDKNEVLHNLIKKAAHLTGISEEYLGKEIFTREEQASTAIGKGIAMPHAHIKGLKNSKLFVVKNPLGIDWDSPDGELVHFVFLILSPIDNPVSQLKLMQDLIKILSVPDILNKLLTCDDTAKIYNILAGCISSTDSHLGFTSE